MESEISPTISTAIVLFRLKDLSNQVLHLFLSAENSKLSYSALSHGQQIIKPRIKFLKNLRHFSSLQTCLQPPFHVTYPLWHFSLIPPSNVWKLPHQTLTLSIITFPYQNQTDKLPLNPQEKSSDKVSKCCFFFVLTHLGRVVFFAAGKGTEDESYDSERRRENLPHSINHHFKS